MSHHPLGSLVSTGYTIFAGFTLLTGVTIITWFTSSTRIMSFKSFTDSKPSPFLESGKKRAPVQQPAQWSVTYKTSDQRN